MSYQLLASSCSLGWFVYAVLIAQCLQKQIFGQIQLLISQLRG